MPQQRVYNALNGDEIRKIVLAEIDRELSMDSNFRQHKTYHMPAWEWHLTMRAVPESRGPIEAKASGAVVLVDETTKQPVPYDDDDLLVIEHSSTAKPSSQPDRVRETANLPVPTPTQVPRAGKVDVPTNRDRVEKTRRVSLRKGSSGSPAESPGGVAPLAPGAHLNNEAKEVVSADK